MKCLNYPFDSSYILKKKKSIRRELLGSGANFIEKRIAVLGGSTTAEIRQILELFLLHHGIRPVFYESEYNQFYSDAVFSNETLDAFRPDVVYICTSRHNIERFPTMTDCPEDVVALLDAEFTKFCSVWEGLHARFHCPVIQNNFELPTWRLLGNWDGSNVHGAVNFITRLNLKFAEYFNTHENLFLCDINYLSACYGLDAWSDAGCWHLYKYALSFSAIPLLAHNVANIIKSIFGKNKKALVLDLDNTLWGGVIGDDGADHIEIGPETSVGQSFLAFQEYIKAQKQLGVLLAVSSKNDEDNALQGLNHPSCILRPDDFVKIKANWNAKSVSVSEIASELNILPESLVFVDDNPAERTLVAEQLPGVATPELGVVENYIQILDRSGFFEVTSITGDDFKRNEMYRQNAAREQMKAAFVNYEDYLRSLKMVATVAPFEELYMARIAQLTNKTNQFNLTTRRYTQAELEQIAGDAQYITLYGSLRDRFGDNGVVTVLIAKQTDDCCSVDLWLMSCRVLQRNLEHLMMDRLVDECLKRGIQKIRGFYYKTAKNRMVADFYQKMGFEKASEADNGDSEWEYVIPAPYIEKNTIIEPEKET